MYKNMKIVNSKMQCPECKYYKVEGGVSYHVYLSIITMGVWAVILAEFWFFRWILQLLHIVKPWDGCYEYSCELCGYQWRGKPETYRSK